MVISKINIKLFLHGIFGGSPATWILAKLGYREGGGIQGLIVNKYLENKIMKAECIYKIFLSLERMLGTLLWYKLKIILEYNKYSFFINFDHV